MEKFVFIDETGTPQFYAKRKRPLWEEPEFVPIVSLGMIITDDRVKLRKAMTNFASTILNDPLLNSIYSVQQPGWHLHACMDHSDVIFKTIEFLRQLEGFQFKAVIGRKNPEIFATKHNGNATEFYFDLIRKLLELENWNTDTKYSLYLSQRQSNTEQRFKIAFEKAAKATNVELSSSCTIVRYKDFPEMGIVDYLLWALQRYILRGEKRYFFALEKHYHSILDVYENEGKGKLYNEADRFELKKATPFATKK